MCVACLDVGVCAGGAGCLSVMRVRGVCRRGCVCDACACRVQTWGGAPQRCHAGRLCVMRVRGVSRRGGVRRWCWMPVCDACAWRVQTWGCAPQRCRAGPCSDWTCRRYSARTPDATTRT